MNCPDPQIISALADGELDPKQAAEVERHVARCASCRRSLEEMRSLEQRGRAAVEAIDVGEAAIQNVVYLRPFWLRWVGPMPLAAAAAAVVAIFIGTRLALNHSSSHQKPTSAPAAAASSDESEDAAFAQWLEPYRNLNIPLVPMDVAANYDPAPILPTRPDNIGRN